MHFNIVGQLEYYHPSAVNASPQQCSINQTRAVKWHPASSAAAEATCSNKRGIRGAPPRTTTSIVVHTRPSSAVLDPPQLGGPWPALVRLDADSPLVQPSSSDIYDLRCRMSSSPSCRLFTRPAMASGGRGSNSATVLKFEIYSFFLGGGVFLSRPFPIVIVARLTRYRSAQYGGYQNVVYTRAS